MTILTLGSLTKVGTTGFLMTSLGLNTLLSGRNDRKRVTMFCEEKAQYVS